MWKFTDKIKKPFLLALAFALFMALAPVLARADNFGDKAVFNIDKTYDSQSRTKTPSTLVWVGSDIYFYVDDQWWAALDSAAQAKYNIAFQNLNTEFSSNIRPKLVSLFGTDVNPVINRDGKLTILVHPMVKDAGGYINTGDGYFKNQASNSNEREMVYFNTLYIDSPLAKSYLAHEFTHLITLNQKDRLRGVSDDVWLNEARAEYSSTILGYDEPFSDSNFEQRSRSFAADSSKSLVEWANKTGNYGAAHLFMQYLADRYGINVIADSMKTDKTSIDSINYALVKNGFGTDFVKVFRDWVVALAANDCGLGQQYCYKYAGLRRYIVPPKINYLPNSDQISFSVMYNTNYFSGNWQKIVGGAGDLRLDFSSDSSSKFLVPYLLCETSGKCKVGDLETAGDGKAVLNLADFGQQYASLTLIPFATGKTSGFDDYIGTTVSYSFKIEIKPKTATSSSQNVIINQSVNEDQKIQAMLAQIEILKKEIARLQALLAARLGATPAAASVKYSCDSITANLYFGVENYAQTRCLQEFLKNQGAAIYPEAKITGNFSVNTQAAVIRFQEKYASEILTPLGFKKGTGYVGVSTRAKINQMLAAK